ncbi:uncharacterized protein TRUGW13939_08108 [Talaromyces rugulosus]|uniref:Uncharacterized protein n=1 Tax=Talaromyces rugulosus TaxID=121627 RepID=A0A7H8R3Q9_TALRU|nr:uncharacterized protein TRUGW13939_08108 [Talaromyces rugulosus]QKX60962.1 hypothetical protein TRUGW13939_08108 [Talaromyces rugulosus]
MGDQSFNSLALISSRYTTTAVKVLIELAAAHIFSLCQALDLRAMKLLVLHSVHTEFNTEERFVHIGKSMRVTIIDYLTTPLDPLVLEEMEALVMKVTLLLQEGWYSSMNVYLDHYDASPILGTALKSIYEYVRKTLGIPFLHTARILTPIPYKASSN